MSEKRRRWFDSPYFLAFVIVCLVLSFPLMFLLGAKTYVAIHKYRDGQNVVLEIGDSTVYSREEIVEAAEVVKDDFYDDFPYSEIEKITYIDSSDLKKQNQMEFEVSFYYKYIFEEPAAKGLENGHNTLWYWCKKTEDGNWKSTGFSSIS